MKTIRHINFRSAIDFCNYNCSYCPFSKNSYNADVVEKDKKAFGHFHHFLENNEFDPELSVLLTPYGEGLILPHYLENFVKLSQNDKIKHLSTQTNLSFNVEKFINHLKVNNANLNKINLWVSYHFEHTSIDDFITKVKFLEKYISVVVVVVGIDSLEEDIKKLENNVNVRINTFDGPRQKKQEFFKTIDSTYMESRMNFTSDYSKCLAGKESLFINEKGNIYPCNINKQVIGSLKNTEIRQLKTCKCKYCNCFLSYVNRIDYPFWGEKRFLRLNTINSIVFDIDDTLAYNGIISEEIKEHLKRLSSKYNLYLATSRSYDNVYKSFHCILKCFKGGVFSAGAEIYFHKFTDKILEKLTIDQNIKKAIKVINDNTLVKVMSKEKVENNNLNVIKDDAYYIITAQGVNKKSGVLKLGLDTSKTLAVGNSINDLDMLKAFNNSVTVNKELSDGTIRYFDIMTLLESL